MANDLPAALSALFSGGDVTIFKATVDAVDSFGGTLTIHANGGSFTDVPYLIGGWPFSSPSINDITYVIGKKGWGMLALGMAAPSDREPVGDSSVFEWEPFARARWNPGSWTVPPLDAMRVEASVTDRAAVYFFNLSDLAAWPVGAEVGSLSLYLEIDNVTQDPEMARDNVYVRVGLHSTASPTGTLARMENLDAYYKLHTGGSSGYFSAPLHWAANLLNGTAKGFYVDSPDLDLTVLGPATIRLTAL